MRIQHALLGLLLCAPLAAADEVIFYRCTDASGALTLQNMPCPKGDKQEKKVMQSVSAMPMSTPVAPSRPVAAQPAAPRAATTPPTAAVEAMTAPPPKPVGPEAKRLPPPVLFQCTTADKDSYVTEDMEPPSRCVVLRTTGLDGNPQSGAGEACEVVRDQCARVPDGALCEAWEKRLGETSVALRFGRPENQEKNRAEHERVQEILSNTACKE